MIHKNSDSFSFVKDIKSENCWTSSIICQRKIVKEISYKSKSELELFDFEDWEWNRNTISANYPHKIVPNTFHFVRQRKNSLSRRQYK